MAPLEMSFPAEFDHQVYVNHSTNSDVSTLGCVEARSHYECFGKSEGRICNHVSDRRNFLQLVPADASILEIGPFNSPSFKRPESDVYYLDCIPTEKMLQRASEMTADENEMREKVLRGYVPKIDYVWKNEKFSELINRKFPVIFSSHNIEHHPCLISHLQNLESSSR
jgi:hypothetical protein